MRTFVLRARAAPTDSRKLLAAVGQDAHPEILAHTLMNAIFVAQSHRPAVVVYLVLESTADFSRTIRFDANAMHDLRGFHESALLGVIARTLDASVGMGKEETRPVASGVSVRTVIPDSTGCVSSLPMPADASSAVAILPSSARSSKPPKSCTALASKRIVREKSWVLSSTRWTTTSARCDCATKIAFISVCARISGWASVPTAASSFRLSVGAARALSTKVRMWVLAWFDVPRRAAMD